MCRGGFILHEGYIRNFCIAAHSQHSPSLAQTTDIPYLTGCKLRRMSTSSIVRRSAASVKMLPRFRPQTASRRCVMTLADHKVCTGRPMSRECRHSRDACSSTRPTQPLVVQAMTALSRPTTWNCDGACLRPSGVAPTPRTLASFWPWAILVRHIPRKKT